MKPKNRVHCKDCGKLKILFDTYESALNFIKWNWEELTDNISNLRIYYCIYCGGYHITSKNKKKNKISRTNKVVNMYNKEKRKKNIKHIKIEQNYLNKILDAAYIELKESNFSKSSVKKYCEEHKLPNNAIQKIKSFAKKYKKHLRFGCYYDIYERDARLCSK